MKSFGAYILDLCGKKEGYTIEFKGAKGGFPGSFWETYSAFANTAGRIRRFMNTLVRTPTGLN